MASFKLKLRLFLSNLMLFLLFFFATAFWPIECGNRFSSTSENIGYDYFFNKRLHNLHKAIESKNPKEVKTLLEKLKPDQVDLLNKVVDDKTPLGHAITQVTSPNQEDDEKEDAEQVLQILAKNEFVEINKTSESGVTSLILALGAEDPLAAENVAVILFESTISSNTEASLSRKLNVTSIDPDTGNTPLHIASERGLEKVVRLLVTNFKGEIELNAKNKAGKTPLHLALSKDDLAHKAIVDLLLEVLNIDSTESDSRAMVSSLLQQEGIDNPDQEVSPSLLELAYEKKNERLGKFLLTHFEDKVFDTNTYSNIFHQAAKSGKVDMIDWIVKLKPDIDGKIVNLQDQDGNTALHVAVMKVYPNVVQALLNFKHIDVVKVNNQEGKTASDLVGNNYDTLVVDLLLKHGKTIYDWVLKDLIENKFSEARMNYWLNKGLDIDAKDRPEYKEFGTLYRSTLLMHIVTNKAIQDQEDRYILAKFLISKGANVNEQDSEGDTVLHLASRTFRSFEHLIQLFIDNKADVTIKNTEGHRPSLLELTYEKKNERLGKFLLTHCYDKLFGTNTDSNIFHQVAKSGKVDIIEWVVHLKPDIYDIHGSIVNLQDKDRSSPLYVAVIKKYPNVVEALLKFKNIDVNLGVANSPLGNGPKGITPLYVAVLSCQVDIVKLLLEAPGINTEIGFIPNFSKHSDLITPLRVAATSLIDTKLEITDKEITDKELKELKELKESEAGSRRLMLEILYLLVQSNANVNLEVPAHNNGFLGGSILHLFVFHNEIKAVNVILKSKNIDLSTKNKAGQSALDVAKEKGYTEIVDLINKKLSGK